MIRTACCLLFLLNVASVTVSINFHIGALIPEGVPGYVIGYQKAIELAVETIHNKSILQGHHLVVHYKITLFKSVLAIDHLIKFKSRNPPEGIKIGVIGPATSNVAYYTARLSTIWGPLQLSYGASTPDLLDGETYPRFLTVVPTTKSLNKALIKLLEYFHWKRVGVIYDVNSKDFFLPTMFDLQEKLLSKKFDVVKEGVSVAGNRAELGVIEKMKANDIRIVIALLHFEGLEKLFCEVFRQGYYGQKIVWIIYMAGIKNITFKKYCNTSSVHEVTKRMLILDFLYLRTDQKKTISGLTAREYNKVIKSIRTEQTDKHSLAFDTTWLLALAINASLTEAIQLQESTQSNMNTEVLNKIREKILEIDFEGISGNVKFNGTERLGTAVIRQVIDRENVTDIAQYVTRTNVFTFYNNNNSTSSTSYFDGNIIRDGPVHIHTFLYFSSILCTTLWICSSLGIIFALYLFFFNYQNREIRYIKMSSPYFNNIIIFGGLLSYIKVILDTFDARFLTIETYGRICNVRVWLMSLGFTTAFGAMFSKTWRVHKIFTASQNFKKAVVKNFHLYGLLAGLLFIDVTLLFLWTYVSPYKYDMFQLPIEAKPEEDKVFHPFVYRCASEHAEVFLITSFCYKGLLLIFGLFLAWETRDIEIKALNDSKYIGMSVYNVVILSVVGVLVSFLMSDTYRYNLYLALVSFLVILVTTSTLAIVFVPKILGLHSLLHTDMRKSVCISSQTDSSSQKDCCCCCCENCKCRDRRSSVHVNDHYLASYSNKFGSSSRKPTLPSVSETRNGTETSY